MSENLLDPESKIDIFRKQGANYNSIHIRGHMTKEELLQTKASEAFHRSNSVELLHDNSLRHQAKTYFSKE